MMRRASSVCVPHHFGLARSTMRLRGHLGDPERAAGEIDGRVHRRARQGSSPPSP